MTYDEAIAWLRGERSNNNYIRGTDLEQGLQEAYIAMADGASTQQAFYTVQAHQNGWITDKPEPEPVADYDYDYFQANPLCDCRVCTVNAPKYRPGHILD